jgi:hypothetical protein
MAEGENPANMRASSDIWVSNSSSCPALHLSEPSAGVCPWFERQCAWSEAPRFPPAQATAEDRVQQGEKNERPF